MLLADTFRHFQDLPEEIRREIWKLSPSPRIIHIRLRPWNQFRGIPVPADPNQPLSQEDGAIPPHKAPPPPELLVCRESRSEIARLYKPFKNGPTFYAADGTWVNAELDIIYCADILFHQWWYGFRPNYLPTRYYFPDHYSLSRIAFDEVAVQNITKLALPLPAFKIIFDTRLCRMQDLIPVFKKYKSLKELILVEVDVSGGSGFSRKVDIDDISMWEEGHEPMLEDAQKWHPSDVKGDEVMMGGYMQVSVVIAQLKKAERMDDEGWKAPEIKYMRIVKQGTQKKQKRELWGKLPNLTLNA